MIIKVKKLLFFGIKDQVDIFFSAAQEKGFIEFIGPSKKIKILSDNVKNYIFAIKILKKQPNVKQLDTPVSTKTIVKKVIHLNDSLERLFEDKRLVEAEIARIAPFGDFSLNELKSLEDSIFRYFQFFAIKKSKREKIKLPEELIYVNNDHDLDYFISINKEKKIYPKMIEIIIDQPLNVLKEKKEIIEKQILKTEKEIKEFAVYLNAIKHNLLKEFNIFNLEKAKKEASFPIEDSLFSIEAWVPVNKMNDLKMFLKTFNIDFTEIRIEKKDRVPTYMLNKKASKIGEDLVNIYDVPSIKDKDPSLWVLSFFALFFAIIVSDAGYGLVFLVIALALRFIFKKVKPVIARFFNLFLIISIVTIIWGALTGSFFGFGVDPKSSLDKLTFINYLAEKKAEYHLKQKDDVYDSYKIKYPKLAVAKSGKDFIETAIKKDNSKITFEALDTFKSNILMEFSLILGIIHISFSLMRYFFRNWPSVGWVVFMIGGYLFFPKILNATTILNFLNIMDKPSAYQYGEILIFAGIAISLILAVLQKKIMGILEITIVVQVFADVLSYLRLYALGLAGMIMATTFNDIGSSMGLSFGFIIIIFGHLINITLNTMSGIIHGLRLNFIEWYHYSFEGDGKLFDPLRLLK
ncbi:MAG: V-type ATP synthase subunit I [Parachlamydiales bacterium]|nr:V-type ATP synthase subunit I [Parachlamydiales bacterium]